MARKKKTVKGVTIHGIADKGRAVGKAPDGQVVFVEDAVPGDVADVLFLRKRKGVWFGRVTEYVSRSPHRVEPVCGHFELCGGCKWQHLDYEQQLVHKDNIVHNALTRIGGCTDLEFGPIIGAKNVYQYRNKLEYTFSNKRWLTEAQVQSGQVFEDRDALGFHRPGMFDKVVHVTECHLQVDIGNAIRNAIYEYAKEHKLSFFDIRNQEGFLRNLVIRTTSTGELMVIVVFHEMRDEIFQLLDFVYDRFPEIESLQYAVNTKKNDSLQDVEILLYKGREHIVDRIGHVSFQIGPHSFFQTNTEQALVLFSVVRDFADLKGHENVYDLYSGIGSISLFLAKECDRIVGIESVEPAVEDAEINRKKNGIENAAFEVGDVKDLLHESFVSKYGLADLIITDPPRAGMHQDVVETLIKLKVPRLIYVSCNPATQARDLKLLETAYKAVKSQAVDMFPHTHHIENVVLLEAVK